MSRRTILLTTAGVVAALGIAAAIAVPAANEWLDNRHQETSSYATGAEAKKARVSVPRWLPDGAESVKYSMKTTGGERLLEAALPDGKPRRSARRSPPGTPRRSSSRRTGSRGTPGAGRPCAAAPTTATWRATRSTPGSTAKTC